MAVLATVIVFGWFFTVAVLMLRDFDELLAEEEDE